MKLYISMKLWIYLRIKTKTIYRDKHILLESNHHGKNIAKANGGKRVLP